MYDLRRWGDPGLDHKFPEDWLKALLCVVQGACCLQFGSGVFRV